MAVIVLEYVLLAMVNIIIHRRVHSRVLLNITKRVLVLQTASLEEYVQALKKQLPTIRSLPL